MEMDIDIDYPYQLRQETFCKYTLVTPSKDIQLNFPQVLDLRRKINILCTFESLNEIINSDNFVLLFLADKEHLLYLDIPQLLQLEEEVALFFHAPAKVYV